MTPKTMVRAALVAMLLIAVTATTVTAFGFLEGTFWVRCPNCRTCDKVEQLTRGHRCSNCNFNTVDNGDCIVVCPNGHDCPVSGVTRQHVCRVCQAQCRDGTKPAK